LITRAPATEAAIVEIVDDIFLPLVRARSAGMQDSSGG
jgi:hypothetical protein